MTEFYSFGIPSKAIAVDVEAVEEVKDEFDLVTFLAFAQAYHIDFLPIPWNPALEGLGTGSTGDVREAYITLRVSFAIKRVAQSWIRKSSEFDVFMALLSEIQILGQDLIRKHPNIVTLEGLCWDFVPQSTKAWPVFVFEKTELGTTENFASSGNSFSWSQRIDLCADIGSAVDLMHSQHVVHGDLKPSNVLIFPDGASGIVAKVTDFGFSACYALEKSIHMPRTRPWNAPEWHHHRKYSFNEAMLMDIYSYGMLCMWILFYMSSDNATKEMLSVLDQHESLSVTGLAFKLTDQASLANNGEKQRVSEFFAHSLVDDPKARQASIANLVAQLRNKRLEVSSIDSKALNEMRVQRYQYSKYVRQKFELSRAVFQFYNEDFRVRSYVFQCIEKRVQRLRSTDEHLLIQLALCYKLGFGTAKDDMKAAKVLEGASSIALNEELDRRITEIREDTIPTRSIQGKVRELLMEGHIRQPLFAEVYRDHSIIESFESTSIREIGDLTSVVGANHVLIHSLKDELAVFYMDRGLFSKALPLHEQVYEIGRARFGPDHQLSQGSLANLANTLFCLKKVEAAVKLQSEVMKWRSKRLGKEHPSTLGSMSSLAMGYGSLGTWDKAEELYLELQDVQEQIFGPKHRFTLKTRLSHLEMKIGRGQYDTARHSLNVLMEDITQALGADDPIALLSLKASAILYRMQGRYSEGEEEARCALERTTKALGTQHSETIKCTAEVALFRARQGHSQEAEELLSRALKAAETTLGEEHADTLAIACDWIAICQENGQVDKVQKFTPDLVSRLAAVYGENDAHTLGLRQSLAVSYISTERWVEAEDILTEVIEKWGNAYGKDLPALQGMKSNLASLYCRQKRWNEAESLCRDTLDSWKKIGAENMETWSCEDVLLIVLLRREKWNEASELGGKVVIRAKEIFGEMHPLHLRSMERLAEAYKFCGRLEDAIHLETNVVQTRQLNPGNKDPVTLTSMANLAVTKYLKGQISAALELMREVHSLSEEALGAQHPDTLNCAEWIEGIATRGGVPSDLS